MAEEPNLRHLFGQAPTPAIDVSSVLRRSRARRAPRILGAGVFAVLAVGAVAYGGFAGLAGLGGATTASDAGGAEASEETDAQLWSTADDTGAAKTSTIAFCGAPLSPAAANDTGLVLSVDFPDSAKVDAESVPGRATLTNAGLEPFTGSTFTTPMIMLSRDDTVVWHSFPARETMPIDLDPGESIAFEASFTPAVCGPEDDLDGAMRDELPAPAAGEYEVSAATDVYGTGGITVLGGPPQTIALQ